MKTNSLSNQPISFDDLFEILEYTSFSFYASGSEDPLIRPSSLYLSFGKTPEERQRVFREMVEEILIFDWIEGKPDQSLSYLVGPELIVQRLAEIERQKKESSRKTSASG